MSDISPAESLWMTDQLDDVARGICHSIGNPRWAFVLWRSGVTGFNETEELQADFGELLLCLGATSFLASVRPTEIPPQDSLRRWMIANGYVARNDRAS